MAKNEIKQYIGVYFDSNRNNSKWRLAGYLEITNELDAQTVVIEGFTTIKIAKKITETVYVADGMKIFELHKDAKDYMLECNKRDGLI